MPEQYYAINHSIISSSDPVIPGDYQLIPDDSSTLVHVIWRNGKLIDLAGNDWRTAGAGPTYVHPNNMRPAGAKLFSGTDFLYLPAGHPLANVGDFSGIVIAEPAASDLSSTSMLLSNMVNLQTNGWQLVANEGGTVRFYCSGGVFAPPLTANVPNIIAFASMRSIAQNALKINGRPLQRGNGSQFTFPPDAELRIGTHWDGILPFAGTIYEVYISSWMDSGNDWDVVDDRLTKLTRIAMSRLGLQYQDQQVAPTYGTTVTPNLSLGSSFVVSPTNGVAFTIAAPTNPAHSYGQRISFKIKNASGGALGAVTWNAVYKLAAWTSPANGYSRSIDFIFDGTNWVEASRASADVPN